VNMTDYIWADRSDAGVLGKALGAKAEDASAPTEITGGLPAPVAEPATRKPARPWSVGYRRAAISADAAAGAVAASIGSVLVLRGEVWWQPAALVVLIPLAWVVALALTRGYEKRYLGTTAEEYRAVFRAAVSLFCGVALVSYGGPFVDTRGFVIVVLPLLLAFGLLARKGLRRRLHHRRSLGLDLQKTVVVGDARSVGPLIREIRKARFQGMDVVAACVSDLRAAGADEPTDLDGVPVFGYPEEALAAVDLFDATVVAVSSHPDLGGPVLRRLAWSLEDRDVDLVVAPGILEVAGPRLTIRPAAGMPLLHVERPVMSGGRRLVKTAVDRAMSLTLGLLAAPVLLAIAVAVRLDSTGPILFRQNRVGAHGELFQMLKFRTMCVDAESRLAEVRRDTDAGNEVLFKMKQDPRVTRVGRLLRRYSLDELPQLINVLRGEMSLVGPRPPLPSEVAEYEPDAVRRLRVQPGLTGLWQVSGRSDLPWDESLRLDLWYVDNWSLTLDLQILTRTFRAVLKGQGAY
jgi:exopolysaccharide biosynthesis polyprenyl glycosylphosphotransferase